MVSAGGAVKVYDYVARKPYLRASEKLALSYIQWAGRKGGIFEVSKREIARRLGAGRQTIYTATRTFKTLGYLSQTPHENKTLYQLHFEELQKD